MAVRCAGKSSQNNSAWQPCPQGSSQNNSAWAVRSAGSSQSSSAWQSAPETARAAVHGSQPLQGKCSFLERLGVLPRTEQADAQARTSIIQPAAGHRAPSSITPHQRPGTHKNPVAVAWQERLPVLPAAAVLFTVAGGTMFAVDTARRVPEGTVHHHWSDSRRRRRAKERRMMTAAAPLPEHRLPPQFRPMFLLLLRKLCRPLLLNNTMVKCSSRPWFGPSQTVEV